MFRIVANRMLIIPGRDLRFPRALSGEVSLFILGQRARKKEKKKRKKMRDMYEKKPVLPSGYVQLVQ